MLEEYKDFRLRVIQTFSDDLWCDNLHCSYNTIPPTEEEKQAARVLCWLRDKKKTLEWCIKNRCFPSPKGFKTKSLLWIPSPQEVCQKAVTTETVILNKRGNSVAKPLPYAWWEHCKSYEHCLFLAQHRKKHFVTMIDAVRLSKITAVLSLGYVPALASTIDPVEAAFFEDWCAGKIPDIPKE